MEQNAGIEKVGHMYFTKLQIEVLIMVLRRLLFIFMNTNTVSCAPDKKG